MECLGARLVLLLLNGGEQLIYSLSLNFKATNNKVKYNALITSLSLARVVGVASLRVKCNSKQVVSQVKRE